MGIEPSGVPFGEAIDYFRQKVSMPTRTWTDLWEGMHSRAFVVAGATQTDLIADLRNAVAKALEQGTTIAEFRKDFDQAVAKAGWSYNGGRNWRSRVIFQANLRTAYSAGRWQQAQELKARRPYARYIHTPSQHERPEHAGWHGTVLPLDDPWVSTHWTPNGWGCKCSWQTLSQRDLTRYGYQLTSPAPVTEYEDRQINTASGPVMVKTPKGVDPGWGYNVGEAAWGRGAQRLALEAHGPWEALAAPGAVPPAEMLTAAAPKAAMGARAKGEAALRTALRKAIGGDGKVFADPTGARVNVTQAIVDHMLENPARLDGREAFFPFIPELITDPAEIWIGWARSAESGRVAIRRRYVKLLSLGRDTSLGMVADVDGGQWSGVTFFRGTQARALKPMRTGLRVYRKK